MIPGLSGWFGICRTNVPTGGVYSAGAEVGGGETGRVLVHDCSTCSFNSAGRASNTERST